MVAEVTEPMYDPEEGAFSLHVAPVMITPEDAPIKIAVRAGKELSPDEKSAFVGKYATAITTELNNLTPDDEPAVRRSVSGRLLASMLIELDMLPMTDDEQAAQAQQDKLLTIVDRYEEEAMGGADVPRALRLFAEHPILDTLDNVVENVDSNVGTVEAIRLMRGSALLISHVAQQ